MRKYKNKIILGLIIVFTLAFFFWWGGNAPSLRGTNFKEEINPTQPPKAIEVTGQIPVPSVTPTENIKPTEEVNNENKKEKVLPEQTKESEKISESKKALSCTISVRCDTILNNMDWLVPEKKGIIPSDGVILSQKTVNFNEGQTVFDALLKATKENKIHMEFVNTPIYKSAYIEGIGNIYEFDCGELSGWMYTVNGEFPNIGCSLYNLKDGDKIEWIYTCDLGEDLGGDYASQN